MPTTVLKKPKLPRHMGDGPFHAPIFDKVITKQTMRGLANAENRKLDPLAIGEIDPTDVGLYQVNLKDFSFGYENGFLEKPPKDRNPTELLQNPYINSRVAHSILWKKYDELAGEENEDGTFEKFPVKDPKTGKESVVERKGLWNAMGWGDFKQLPPDEQENMVQLAYTEGAQGLVSFLKKDTQFNPHFPSESLDRLEKSSDHDTSIQATILKNRTEQFRQGKTLPIDEEFDTYLSARDQRKSHVIARYIQDPDPRILETKLKEAGFQVNPDPALTRPTPSISADRTFNEKFHQSPPERVEEQAFAPATTKELPLPELGLADRIMQGISQTGLHVPETLSSIGSAVSDAIGQTGLPSSDQLLDALDTPGQLIRGAIAGNLGGRATGEEALNNVLPKTRQQLQSEVDLAEQAFDAALTSSDGPLTSALIEGQRRRGQAQGALQAFDTLAFGTEIITSAGPIVPGAKFAKKALSKKADPTHGTAVGPSHAVDSPDLKSDIMLQDIDKGQNTDLIIKQSVEESSFPLTDQIKQAKDAQVGLSSEIKPLPKQAETGLLRAGTTKKVKSALALRYRRTFIDTLETMRQLGPSSEKMANAMQEAMMRYENMIVGLSDRQRDIFSNIWGRKSAAALRGVHKGASTQKFFNVSKKESDALLEYLSRGGEGKSPNVKSLLMGPRFKMTEEQYTKIQRTANAVFTDVTGPVSSHPVIRSLKITDPVTGKTKDPGPVSMFYPQVPITDVRKELVKGGKFEMLYNVARAKDPTLNREVFRAKLRDRISAYRLVDLDIARPLKQGEAPSVEQIAEKFQVRSFAGIEQARVFNPVEVADANGISIAEVYRKLGYDDDPIRAITSFTIGGLKRAETGAIYSTIREQLPQAAREIEMNPVTAKHADSNIRFVDRALSHFAGRGGGEVLDTELKGIVGNVLGFQSATLLQAAFISNLAQLSIVGVQATAPSIVKAVGSALNVFRRGDHASDLAATNYITMAQEWQRPGSLMGRIAQDSLRMSAFTPSEKFLRAVAGRVGFYHILNIAKNIQKTPRFGAARHKLKWEGMAIEMGYDPDKLRQVLAKNNGMLPTEELHRGIETFTNRTAGRTDMRGLPLWAAEHRPELKMLLQFKNFGLTNLNTLHKTIADAPTPMIGVERALKALGMGATAGIAVTGMRDAIIKQIWPTDQNGVLTKLEKEPLNTLVSSLTVGLGNVFGMLIASAQSGKDGATDFLIGPTGSMIVGAIETGGDISKGEFDFNEFKTTALRRIPHAPALGPILAQDQREKNKRRKERERKRKSGDGFGSFGGFDGFEGF